MPRRDGSGPLGNGPMRRGCSNCQGMSFGRLVGMFGFTGTNSAKQGSLEDQAARLEEQAANLRKLAKQNSKDK
ncbi:MAG: hypothetical protein H6Q68_579 [Firmicutes bacterium]|nr:hypothetical protein [Bacillota bacterium]